MDLATTLTAGVMILARASATSTMTSILNTLSTWVMIGGGLWGVWGAVTLGTGLKDHNSPGIQSGTWQIVGAAVIMVAAGMFKTIM